jgi:ketose-bisphosphate aldolase
MRDLLAHASRGGYAVGYFEAWDEYSMEAAVEAAVALASPAILGFGAATTSHAWFDAGGIEELAGIARALALRSGVPTAVLFNEARSLEHVLRGIDAGCNAVMLGTAELPLEENIAATRAVVARAHPRGVDVEAELGHLADALDAGAGGVAGQEHRTDPTEARRFVRETGVDALAVAIGTAHCHTDVVPGSALDLSLLDELREAAGVPLVLHGGSGLSALGAKAAIEHGIVKVNYGTRLKHLCLQALRAAVAALPEVVDVQRVVGSRATTDLLMPGKMLVRDQIADLIRLYGAAGRARP